MPSVFAFFIQGMFQREKLLDVVLAWRKKMEGQVEGLPRKGQEWSIEMGKWLAGERMDGVQIAPYPGV